MCVLKGLPRVLVRVYLTKRAHVYATSKELNPQNHSRGGLLGPHATMVEYVLSE